jgi:endonuclease/exonuclease/phosphatase family metal-dependent hydrolase
MDVPCLKQSSSLYWLLGVLACIGACDNDAKTMQASTATTALKVMSRNLYLGANFEDILNATSLAEIPARVDAFWQTVQQSDLPGRIHLVVEEIAAEQPDILALQELELFRVQIPSNFNAASPVVDAETTAPMGDLLPLLQAEMEARGLDYGPPIALNTLTDTELPAENSQGQRYDFRLTDRDAIFVRPGILPSNVQTKPFSKDVTVPIGGFTSGVVARLVRGYTMVSLLVQGIPFTFVNSHLEVGGLVAAFQEAQAEELAATLATIKGTVILAGDFNSPADGSGTKSYATLTRTFTDAWTQQNPSDPGPTCCTQLSDPAPSHTERIDLILFRGNVRADRILRIGMDPAQRTQGSLWPSDHLGLVASLTVGS